MSGAKNAGGDSVRLRPHVAPSWLSVGKRTVAHFGALQTGVTANAPAGRPLSLSVACSAAGCVWSPPRVMTWCLSGRPPCQSKEPSDPKRKKFVLDRVSGRQISNGQRHGCGITGTRAPSVVAKVAEEEETRRTQDRYSAGAGEKRKHIAEGAPILPREPSKVEGHDRKHARSSQLHWHMGALPRHEAAPSSLRRVRRIPKPLDRGQLTLPIPA